jgi:hypothetical protein
MVGRAANETVFRIITTKMQWGWENEGRPCEKYEDHHSGH